MSCRPFLGHCLFPFWGGSKALSRGILGVKNLFFIERSQVSFETLFLRGVCHRGLPHPV